MFSDYASFLSAVIGKGISPCRNIEINILLVEIGSTVSDAVIDTGIQINKTFMLTLLRELAYK